MVWGHLSNFVRLRPSVQRQFAQDFLQSPEIIFFWGTIKTTAAWLREFVHNHDAYGHDSKLNPTIVRDLLVTIDELVHSEQQQVAWVFYLISGMTYFWLLERQI